MKKFIARIMCVAVCICMLVCACFAGCGGNKKGGDEYTLEIEEGCRQVTIYYNRPQGYENCDIWLWYDNADGKGYLFHECEYGAKIVVNVPEAVEEVGFIIRKNCSNPGGTSWGEATKDATESNRYITLKGKSTVIYTKAGDANSYTSDDGGKTLNIIRFVSLANMKNLKTIELSLSDKSTVQAGDITITKDGAAVEISSVARNIITTAAEMDLSANYTVTVKGLDPVKVIPLSYFSSKEFESKYGYDGELGVELGENSTTFKLWAPTASKVVLNLYAAGDGGSAESKTELKCGEKGVWSHTENKNLDGKYYTYTVTTSAGENEAVDPYAVSAGINGNRGMILNLKNTDPEGWDSKPLDIPGYENYTDAQIWEVHVRDFSNTITTANKNYKGKYLAFTERGLTNESGLPVGVDYLVNLGITHVHLQPTFDFASVDEAKNTNDNPSDDQFNWGYDPKNYNVPEGSYATDASDGSVRVKEFKQMVKGLHDAGIGVILDMVYNHTYSDDSNLNKIVPYYYYRYTSTGALSNGSGCGNETASERCMMRKYMIDSVTYWQKEYNVDGFRFDLMGLHDLTTMQEIEKAVHATNANALIYGEGWTGGTSTGSYAGALLKNVSRLNRSEQINGVAMFSDVIRDSIKGSVFDIKDVGFATGAKTSAISGILFGVNGGVKNSKLGTLGAADWETHNPTNIVNYCSAHDNNTLWDRICSVYGEGEATLDARLARNRLSAAIVQTSQGIPFMLAGEEMLRSKKNADGSYNENSYNSSDAVNNIQWDNLKEGSAELATMQYYKGLIAFRKAHAALRQTSVVNDGNDIIALVEKTDSLIAFTVNAAGEELLIIYNANTAPATLTLPDGSWNLYINGTTAGTQIIEANCAGNATISAISCHVYVKAA